MEDLPPTHDRVTFSTGVLILVLILDQFFECWIIFRQSLFGDLVHTRVWGYVKRRDLGQPKPPDISPHLNKLWCSPVVGSSKDPVSGFVSSILCGSEVDSLCQLVFVCVFSPITRLRPLAQVSVCSSWFKAFIDSCYSADWESETRTPEDQQTWTQNVS